MAKEKIAVLGSGSWGITLSLVLHGNGHSVSLWEFDATACDLLRREREEKRKLPGIHIPIDITILNNLEEAIRGCSLIVCAIPTQFIRLALRPYRKLFGGIPFVNFSKGIERDSHNRISEIVKSEVDISDSLYAIVSGPSHAEEVARKIPSAVVAASKDDEVARKVQKLFSTSYFRIYTNDDVIGVELSGALKNVIAIAAGVVDGLGFGDNTKGALLTRGMVEMTRLGTALGASKETFGGLAGMGDLITTCMSHHSRNRFVGEALGRGKKLDEILKSMTMVAEGVETCRSARGLAEGVGVEMPITERMYEVLFNGEDPLMSVKALMERELKSE